MIEAINNFIAHLGNWGPLIACFLIIIESILPFLPLCVFIVINFLAFGNLLGFIISWICTIVGCLMSFLIFRTKLQKWFDKKFRKSERINYLMKKIDKWKFQQLVVILAIPFTPASAINVAAGLSKMGTKKYFLALLIGKIFMVYFWGYVGVSFVECLTNPLAIIKIVFMVLIAYFISNIVCKKFNIE